MAPTEREFAITFMVQLMTSFAARKTDEGTSQAYLLRQADLRSGMLVRQFGIGSGDSASAGIQAFAPF